MARLAPRSGTLADLKDVHGQVHVLAVGVSEQPAGSDYAPLAACLRDAETIRNAFLDVPQLNPDPEHVHALTAKTPDKPTRNVIVAHVKRLANLATEENRVLFYFSGHGERIHDEVYLVPSDAFTSDPGELVPLKDIKAALNGSAAKQKVIVLDACFSGPELAKFKAPPAKQMSKAFWKTFLSGSTGVALIASSTGSQPSTAKSPGGDTSLFTHFPAKALHGEPKALDGGVLTLESFYLWVHAQVVQTSESYNSLQTPTREIDGAGGMVLGDFSAPLGLDPTLRLSEFDELEASDTRSVAVNEILTQLTNFIAYPVDKIEWMANQNLDSLSGSHAKPAAVVAEVLEVSFEDVPVSGARLEFPEDPTRSPSTWPTTRGAERLPEHSASSRSGSRRTGTACLAFSAPCQWRPPGLLFHSHGSAIPWIASPS